jgi:outer membrane lipoprotein LolB
MQQHLGWQLPVDAMVYWIRGMAAPGTRASSMNFDGAGRLISLSESGWEVTFEEYTGSYGYAVPSRMTVQREQLKLRLSINKWTVPSDS